MLLVHITTAARYIHTAGRFMHMLPAGLWSVIAPLQLSPTFRAKHRTTHRRLGRLFILMSTSISLGVVPIVFNEANTPSHSVRRQQGEAWRCGCEYR